jgi:autotransporter-associated beta strand protein
MKSRRSFRRTSGRIHLSSSTALGSLALAAGALLSPFTSPAAAATQTLNVSGNWDTTSPIWDAGATWVNGNDASFGGTAATIEIAGSISVAGLASANDLVFNDAIPGGTLTLVEAGAITPFITGGNDLTFNVGLAGTSGLNINNAGGTVFLNADNPLSGPLTVTAGSLVLGANGAVNSVSSLNIAAAGSVTTGAINQIAQAPVTNAGTLNLGGNDTVASYTSNGGTLNGPGRLTASTYALNDGSTVNAQLGNGIITTAGTVALNANTGSAGSLTVQSGTTTAAAAVGATVVNVNDTATLATTATGSLADTAAVTLIGTGALDLGQNETIANLSGGGSVDLDSHTLTLSNGANASSSAAITGTGGVTLQSGTQTLSGASTYTGPTNVTGGTLVLTGSLAGTTVNVSSGAALSSNGALADATNLTLGVTGTATFTGNETLANLTAGTGAINATGVDLTVTGTLDTAGNITVDDLAVGNLNGTSNITSSGTVTATAGNFGGVIVSGALVKADAGTLTLTGPQTYTGGTTVNGGTLALGHGTNTLADTGALTVNAGATADLGANTDTVAAFTSNGGTLAGTGTLTAATYALNNGATIDANLGAGALTANGTVNINGNTGTGSVSIQSGTTTLAGASSAATVAVSNGATLATTATGSLADTAAVTLAGALVLGQNETIGNLNGAGTVDLGASTLTLSNGANATSSATIAGTGGLTLQSGTQTLSGANTYTGATNITGGTLALTGTLTSTAVNVASGAALTSTGGLADATVLSLTGSATFTGAETLASLDGSGTLSATAVTVGTLNGTGTINASGAITASSGDFGGVIVSGSLVKNDAGTLALTGSNTYTGGTTVNAGTLALGHATNTLSDAGGLTLNPGGTVDLGANTETVAAFTSTGGTLNGAGTLTAATYALNNGTTINADLGAGALSANGVVAINGDIAAGSVSIQSGTTTLSGASSAATVGVSAGATLATTADERLSDTAAVTNAGTLAITGSETVGSLNNTGTISGPGVLTTENYNLAAGSNITGNLGQGTVNVSGNTGISGTSAASTVNITGGTLTLTGDNLADTAVVNNSAGLAVTGNDTVATLNNSGTVSGAGTLTADTYNLASGSNITGNLGTGTVNVTGNTSISGTSAAAIVNVADAANLTISGNNLSDTAALTVDGTVTVQGNDTIGSLVSSGGTIAGFATLTAATYVLNDGTTVEANLGAGALTANGAVVINGLTGNGSLTVESGQTTLNSTSTANTVNVTGGALVLTADGEINVATTVGIASGASLTTAGINQIGNATLTNAGTLTLGGNDIIAAYIANGGTLNGAGVTLTAATYALNDGATVNANLGNGALTSNGLVAINGTVGTGSFTVESGVTTLANTAAADTVAINGGTLALAGSNLLADTATVTNAGTLDLGANSDTVAAFVSNGGTLAGTGTLTAATYALNNGTVIDANLGTGTLTANGTVLINGDTAASSVTVQSGPTTLAGASAATTVQVDDTATLATTETGTLDDTAAVTLTGTGTLAIGQDETIGNLSGAGSVLLDDNTLTLSNGVGTTSAAVISGTGGLTLLAGSQSLAGDSTYTGPTNINGGSLILGGTLQSTEVSVADGAMLVTFGGLSDATNLTLTGTAAASFIIGDETLASLAGAGTVDAFDLSIGSLSGTAVINGFNVTVSSGTFDGVIASGTLVKDTAGTLTLTATQGYTGGTTVTGGTLVLAHATDTLADLGTLTVETGATVDIQANTDTVSAFTSNGGTLAGTGTLTAATYALNTGTTIDANLGDGALTANGTVTINGDTGAGSFNVQTGTTTLAGASAATVVSVNDTATLATTDTGSLADTAALTLTGTGTLALGQDETIGNLNGAGLVQLDTHTLTLSNGAGATSAAVISGTGGLTLVSGTQTLSGNSTYTGDTNVNGGTLVLNGTNTSANIDISAGAALTTGSAERIANTVVVTNDGTFNLGGNETLGALSGTGVVELGVSNLTFAGNGDAVPGEFTSDFSGSINGSGTITKAGTDIQVLSGASAYTGIARVEAGVLRVTHGNALGATGSNGRTEVLAGGTLQLSGGITLAEVVRPTGVGAAATFTGNDSYLTSLGAINNLSGDNTLTGQIGIVGGQPDVIIGANAGTLALNGDILRFGLAAIPKLTFQAAEGSTISLTGTNVVFQLSNIVDIAKTGGGTLDLTTLIANQSTGNLQLHDGTVLLRTQAQLGGSNVIFGDTDRGTLRIAASATQTAIAPGGGQFVTGGDGDFADFRNTVFNFAAGNGTLFTDADTAVRLSNLVNFADSRIVKSGEADLLLDLIDPLDPLATVKIMPSLLVEQGDVYFLAADGTELTLGGLDQAGAGGNLNFGAINTTIEQDFVGSFGGNLTGTGSLTINATNSGSLTSTGALVDFASVTIGGDDTGAVILNGDSTYTGPTNIVSGGNLILGGTLQSLAIDVAANASLTLTASERLADAATLTNAGLVDLDANDETVASFTSNGGTLAGTGTLTAATYALNDGTTIDANLGNGALTANGLVAINGDTGAGTFTVQTGTTTLAGASSAADVIVADTATLATTATGSLLDSAAVTLVGTGTLALGQDETIGNLNGDGFVQLGASTLSLSDGNGANSAAEISGTGGVTLLSGEQFLSGNNTYTGETNVNGGLLALLGSLTGTTVNVADGAAFSSTGGLSDDTDLTLTGTAIATFYGAETLASLNGAGTLDITDLDVTTLNGTALINSSGVVTVANGSFGGSIASGELTKVSADTLTLSGTSTSTGVVTVWAGTLELANATDTLGNDAALVVNAGATVDLGANTDTVGSFTSNAGTLDGTGTLTAATYDLNDGSVTNANLGDGTGTISGDVRLNASTGAGTFTILNGGTLRGVGTSLGGNLVVDVGGTLAPGASPGITTIAGDWTQNGTVAIELAGLGGAGAVNGHDRVNVGGVITLGPASTLDLQRFGAYGEPDRGDSFRIISGNIANQVFANVTSEFTTGLVLDLADGTLYGTGLTGVGPSRRVDLTTLPGLDSNTLALVGALQADAFAVDPVNGVQFNSSLGAGAPAGAAIRALLTSAIGPSNGINTVSPESFAAETGYAVRATRHYTDTALTTAPVLRTGDFSLFAAYSSHQSGTDSSVNMADYEIDGSGGLVGGRMAFNRVSFGAFAAFDSGQIESTYRRADVDGMVYGLFAEAALTERFILGASVFTGSYESDSSRASLFAGPRARADGIESTAHGFSLGLRHDLVKTGRVGFSPYVEFNYTDSSSDAFVETGAADALAVDSIDYTSLRGELGARGYIMVTNRFSFTGQLGVSQEFGDDETEVNGRLVSGVNSMRVVSPGPGDTAVTAGAGVRFDATPRLFLNAGINAAMVSDADTSTSFHVGGGMKF